MHRSRRRHRLSPLKPKHNQFFPPLFGGNLWDGWSSVVFWLAVASHYMTQIPIEIASIPSLKNRKHGASHRRSDSRLHLYPYLKAFISSQNLCLLVSWSTTNMQDGTYWSNENETRSVENGSPKLACAFASMRDCPCLDILREPNSHLLSA